MICIVKSNPFSFCSHLPIRMFLVTLTRTTPQNLRIIISHYKIDNVFLCFVFALTYSIARTQVSPHFLDNAGEVFGSFCIFRQCVQLVTDHWENFSRANQGALPADSLQKLQVEYNTFFLRAVSLIHESKR